MGMTNIFKGRWMKNILAVVLTVILITMPAFTGFAAANQSGVLSAATTKNDADFDAVLEYVNSDMEEKAVTNEDGTISNYYSSASEAGVSEKAFQAFEAMLVFINKEVKAGNVALGEGLTVNEFYEPNAVITWCFTNSQVQQATKLLNAGAALATLASYLGVPLYVAAGLAAISALGNLCNWFDKGFCIQKLPTTWICIPKI